MSRKKRKRNPHAPPPGEVDLKSDNITRILRDVLGLKVTGYTKTGDPIFQLRKQPILQTPAMEARYDRLAAELQSEAEQRKAEEN